MKLTTNYSLNKPDLTDIVDIEPLNENFDILDKQVFNKVEKVSGKDLSTNDYTTAEKNKLAGMESGANKYIHPSSGITPGTYSNVTVDINGHVTSGDNLATMSTYSEDYAYSNVSCIQYFEWNNVNTEVNRFVTLNGSKISIIDSPSDYILGVVSDIIDETWSTVVLTGVVCVRDNGKCEVDSFCTVGDSGEAIPTTDDNGYRVIERVSENIIKIIFR